MFSAFRHRRWYVSPITLRIMAVNIGALLILALGLLYTGRYEIKMIDAELSALQAEGRLLAAAVAEGGVRPTLSGDPVLAEDLSRQMLRKLVETTQLRIQLFGKTGQLMLDSHQLTGPGGAVEIVALDPPFQTWPLKKKLSFFFERSLRLLPSRLELPSYPEKTNVQDLLKTLSGESVAFAWHDRNGHILLTASLPVQHLKNVLGALMLTREGSSVEKAVRDVQMTVIGLFLWALLATMIMSVYLSETIGTPILRLAEAAEKVTTRPLLKESIPNFAYRRDEIGVLSAALRNMTAGLSDRIEAISNFAADVAHEVRNPLASLKSAVETFAVVTEPGQKKKLLAIVLDDIDRMNRLITDISEVSRVDAELHRSSRSVFSLAELLQEVVARERKAVLNLDKNEKLWVNGDRRQLARVLNNLLINAVSFLPEAGQITFFGLVHDGKTVVHVDNDGPEIPERTLETIFERFYSSRPETEKFGLHSGLGLSISRQIVQAHQGIIFARNLKDENGRHQGVRFTIILPAAAAP